jgi:hypothetical protein
MGKKKNNLKRIAFILHSFMGSLFCVAQQEGRMETDRPDQTESPFIAKKKYLQAEFGFNYEKDEDLHVLVHPTVLWKYGICRRFELRLITEIVSVEMPAATPGENEIQTGLLPVKIGGKISLWEEKGLLPKTSVIFHIAPSNIGSKKFYTSKWAPNFLFTMQHTLSENIGLGYNLGFELDGESGNPSWIYTISPGFNIGKNWYSYIEMFGAVKRNERPQHNIDGGFAYYFNDNLKIDLSSGFGLSESSNDWYGALGFSFRFNTSKKK